MNKKGFEHSTFKKYFGNLRNVRIVAQKSHDTTSERIHVHYPLAREIALGNLARIKGFDSYIHKNVFVLNNLRVNTSQYKGRDIRLWTKKNPDITVLTAQGQITVIECKQEAKFSKDDIDRMARTIITLFDLAGPYTLSDKTTKDCWSKWSFIYKSCYEKDSRYPSLQETLSELFSMKDLSEMQRWAHLIMEYIKSSKFRYIIAFDGPAKREKIQEMMDSLETKVKDYEPSLTDVMRKIYLLSLQDGKIHDICPANNYLHSMKK